MLRREARKEQKDLDGSVREMFYENCIDWLKGLITGGNNVWFIFVECGSYTELENSAHKNRIWRNILWLQRRYSRRDML